MALFDPPARVRSLAHLELFERGGALAALATTLLEKVAEKVAEIPDRVRTGAKVINQTGMLYEWKAAGLRAALGALTTGSRNPSLIFSLHAANSPDKPALLQRDRTLTYAQLDDRMNRAGAGLRLRGLKRGESVILMMRNRPEFLEAQGGAGRFGAAAVSVSWRSTSAELRYPAQHCGAEGLVVEAGLC